MFGSGGMRVDQAVLPRRLAGRPQYLSGWLQCRNAYARAPLLAWPVTLALAAALIWGCRRPAFLGFLKGCSSSPVALVLISAATTLTATMQRHQRAADELMHSWLAALPVRTPLIERVALVPLAAWAGLLVLLLVAMSGGLPLAAVGGALGWLSAGGVLGFAAGWLVPRSAAASAPDSWYARIPSRHRPETASLLPLGQWAVARSRVWARPKIIALWALGLLALPLGTPGAVAMVAMAAIVIGWRLLTLLAAVVGIAFAAARWLTPTPIRFVPFAGSLLYLAWLRQLMTCALALAAAAVLAGPAATHRGVPLTLGWLAFCALASVAACAGAMAPGARTALRRAWTR